LAVLLVLAVAGCEDGGAPAPVAPAPGCDEVVNPPLGQTACEMEIGGESVRYLLFLPRRYAEQAAWPLILFLHGSGESGDNLELVKRYGPPKVAESNPDFPFIVLSPQNRTGDWWSPALLTALLDRIVCQYAVDRQRLYVTGLSLGGYGTWSLALAAPYRFAAIAPVSGGGDPTGVEVLAHLPVWAFHGALDDVVPVREAQSMVEALRAVGGNVTLTVYPNGGHNVWNETYDSPALYDWFLQWTRNEG